MDREDLRLQTQMAAEFLGFLSAVNKLEAPEGTPEPPEVAEFVQRMNELAAEIRARRERQDD